MIKISKIYMVKSKSSSDLWPLVHNYLVQKQLFSISWVFSQRHSVPLKYNGGVLHNIHNVLNLAFSTQ